MSTFHLENGVADDEYCQRLEAACKQAMDEFRPQLVMYVAGADPYCNDQLGGLALTIEGLKRRDRLVFDLAREHQAPIAATFAEAMRATWRIVSRSTRTR